MVKGNINAVLITWCFRLPQRLFITQKLKSHAEEPLSVNFLLSTSPLATFPRTLTEAWLLGKSGISCFTF